MLPLILLVVETYFYSPENGVVKSPMPSRIMTFPMPRRIMTFLMPNRTVNFHMPSRVVNLPNGVMLDGFVILGRIAWFLMSNDTV